MPQFRSIWDVTPLTAHPRAAKLIGRTPFWNYWDEESPFGTDIGADTFADYMQFRKARPTACAHEFLREQLSGGRFPAVECDLLDETQLEEILQSEHGPMFLRRDDLVIGLAFAELVSDEVVDSTVLRLALLALRRQATNAVLRFRAGDGAEGHRQQLVALKQVLESA